ncbi:carbamate kinase [Cryobacterium mesophilum]|uniref:Carbamate kinase n=1 Tax=Terrimesophilobacter mesophilus TaxID=433647 RepID=A0A4R8V8E5_9MICO|nr:carbamate kinase [Terrimesophilobacter mesophilus]MBB5632074.1 carbamate kinase [Terrimesophilobacter mesophilus]TFB78953.1 carbamate kinase [Terrimesophilobacter mesophilus]
MSARTTTSGTVLIAVGGNALVLDGEAGSVERQLDRAADFAESIAELVEGGWTVVVTHGNGPQVGYILRRGELVAPDATIEGLPALPLWLAVADSQGGIGHMLALAIDSAVQRRGLENRAVAVLTHAEVDIDDPAFSAPTKPIGGQLTAEVARRRVAEEGWIVTEVAEDNYRRVVASPRPRTIIESEQIRALVGTDAIVIAAGGGGIPVVREKSGWRAVDAVIDKDRASALLATEIDVETLVLVTGVDEVYVDFNSPGRRALRNVGIEELRSHLASGQFPAGSMGPKVQSAIDFVEGGGGRAVITSIGKLSGALAGTDGTIVTADG